MYSGPQRVLTLVFPLIHEEGKILLGMKKRGFGALKFNGFGGKVEDGETVDQAAARELEEECCITATSLKKMGLIHFSQVHRPEQTSEVHVYLCSSWSGEPVESEEMAPQWFDTGSIPFDCMWPDDRYWMPLFLAGKQFVGSFVFDQENTNIESHTLSETSSLS